MECGAPRLTEADYRNLETRWIDPPLIERARLYRVNSSDGAALVGRNGAGNYAGLAIPNIFPGHDRARDYTLRLDHPELELRSDGTTRPKARYLNPPGRGNRLYMPPGTPAPWLQETSLPMVVVEGPFKALAVWRLAHHGVETPRWLCVGVNGCWGWRGTVGKTTGPDGDRRDVKGTIVDLNRISCEGRPVYLVADTNITTNSSVAAGWREFGNELEGRGANVVMVEVPAELGINGVDDFLARHGPKAGLALFEAAKPRNASRDFHLTDLGNAKRLVRRHGLDLRFVSAWGWTAWDGSRFRNDDLGEVERRAKESVLSLYREAAAIHEDEDRRQFLKFARCSESRQALKAMVDLARSEAGVVARPSDFDCNPWVLNLRNGTLDLQDGKAELRPHSRGDLLTRLAPVAWNPEADCPMFLSFLRQIFAGNEPLIRFVQKLVGNSLTGLTTEQIVIILWGPGANGKSTLVEVLSALLGEYAAKTPVSTFLLKRTDSIPNDLAALQGIRFVYASEVHEGRRLSESLVKEVTGGENIRARFLHREWFEFKPELKLWLTTNNRPVIRGTDNAMWRRIRLVPFQVTFPPEQQDKQLAAKLKTELPGILRWAVDGCLAWQREGLEPPEKVIAATEIYREDMDTIAAFLRDCTEPDPTGVVSAKELYRAYCDWCKENGERPVTKTALGIELGKRGYGSTHKRVGNWRFGLRLRNEEGQL